MSHLLSDHPDWPNAETEQTMTPKQCRLAAAAMEAGEPMVHTKAIELLRAHAAALEEVERLKGLLAAAAKELPHCSGPVHERIAVYRREHAKQIEQARAQGRAAEGSR